jgi:hypothetical protein
MMNGLQPKQIANGRRKIDEAGGIVENASAASPFGEDQEWNVDVLFKEGVVYVEGAASFADFLPVVARDEEN